MSTTTNLILPTDGSRKPYAIYQATDAKGTHVIFDDTDATARPGVGYMVCDLCGFSDAVNAPKQPVWCDHLARATVEGIDGQHLNPELEPGLCQLPFTVKVPMKPTKFCYATVIVEVPHPEGSDAREALWVVKQDGQTEHMSLGFLYEGEGRLAIRSTIFDILRGEWPQKRWACPHPGHDTYTYSKAWFGSVKYPGEPSENDLMSLMLIMQGGKCLPCMEKSWGLPDDDEMVPDI